MFKRFVCEPNQFRSHDLGLIVLLSAIACAIAGCGTGGSSAPTTVTPATAVPAFVQQPQNATIPMGLAASFTTGTNGDGGASFQWGKDGVAIPGATLSSYTTPPTAFSDSGSTFTMTITNSLGSATSMPATLTVTARAPTQGDLRFQQVDALSTVNGYSDSESTVLNFGITLAFGQSTGTPLAIGPNCSLGSDPVPEFRYDCAWGLDGFNLPPGVTGLNYDYFGDPLTSLQSDLTGGPGVATETTGGLDNSKTVFTSIDLEPFYNGYEASIIQTTGTGGFSLTQHTVDPADLQAAAAAEGLQGHVITAISYNNSQIYFLSYGWQSDLSTVYEVQTATVTYATIGSVATSLASQGYIITAAGGDTSGALLLVGTRVKGDTLPRPILIVSKMQSIAPIETGGYAVVAFVTAPDGSPYIIGER